MPFLPIVPHTVFQWRNCIFPATTNCDVKFKKQNLTTMCRKYLNIRPIFGSVITHDFSESRPLGKCLFPALCNRIKQRVVYWLASWWSQLQVQILLTKFHFSLHYTVNIIKTIRDRTGFVLKNWKYLKRESSISVSTNIRRYQNSVQYAQHWKEEGFEFYTCRERLIVMKYLRKCRRVEVAASEWHGFGLR
jgi:hypothetical protein